MSKTLDADEIRRWYRIFKRPGELFEIRLLCDEKRQFPPKSAYFDNIETAIATLVPLDRLEKYQVYFSVNEVNPACNGRTQYNDFKISEGSSTSKNDIIHRWWMPIDVDVERPTKISSSNEEKDYAHKKAGAVFRFLKENGFGEPVVCDSSSGYHLYYPIDLPADKETENLTIEFFSVLSDIFTDNRVKIDNAVCDANRIMRLMGTWGRKGRDSDERPHRLAKILYVPKELNRMGAGVFQNFISQYKVEKEPVNNYRPRQGSGGNYTPFDLRDFIAKHGIRVHSETVNNGDTKFVLEECPFDSSHKHPDSAIFLYRDGSIGFKCFHQSCSRYQWRDVRLLFEPDAYDRQYEPRQYQQQSQGAQPAPYTPKPKYEIKNEIPELGDKWLSMSAIKKIDLTQLEKVRTGFTELDKRIGGLYMSEVTILSGSNSSGKSSWLNTLLLNIIQQSYKVALWSGELRADILKTWIQMVAAGADNLRESRYDDGRCYVPDMIGQRIDEWLDGKFFLYNNSYGNKVEQMLNDMDILVKAGVKIFLLDNLMSLDVDLFEGDKNNKQKGAILSIKEFAMKNMVHILLVAHPRKVMTFLRKNDISGTSDITNAVDNVFIMHRTNIDFIKAITEFYGASKRDELQDYGNILSVEKNRLYGVVDFMCGFHYDLKSRRFKNTQEERTIYGWEAAPVQQSMSFETATTETIQQNETKETTDGMPFDAMSDDAPPF